MTNPTARELLPIGRQSRLDNLRVVGRRPRAGALQGDRRSLRRGANVEFADFRPYTSGDDLRQIDWNAYARLDKFFLKLFVEEEDTVVHVLIDSSKSMGWGQPAKLDFAREVAAAIGYVALARLDWLRMAAYATAPVAATRPLRGRSSVPEMCRVIGGLEAAGGTALGASLRRIVSSTRRPGPMLILSDLYDETWRDGVVVAAGARFDVTVVHVLSREEVQPSLAGDFRLIDDETGEAVDASVDGDTLGQYQSALAAWQRENADWCAARAVAYVPVVTDAFIDDFVLSDLRRRGVVAAK